MSENLGNIKLGLCRRIELFINCTGFIKLITKVMQYMQKHPWFLYRKGCVTKNLSLCVQPCKTVSKIIGASGFY